MQWLWGRCLLTEISQLQDLALVVLGWMMWMVSWCSRSWICQSRTIGIEGLLLPLPANTLITVVEPGSNAFTVFYAAATALEMPVWNTVVIPTLVLIHITIINCERETNNAKRQRQRRIFFAICLRMAV
jgi:hypothetical protein